MKSHPFLESSIKLLLEMPEIEAVSRDPIPKIRKLPLVANDQESAAPENTLRKTRRCIVHYDQINLFCPQDVVEDSKKLEMDFVPLRGIEVSG
jgi:hypothetical protein